MTYFVERSGRMWACAVVVVTVALAMGLGGPPLYRWTKAQSADKAAVSIATGLGLHLTDADTVLYSKTYSSFPDSSAFLVIESSSLDRAEKLRTDSGLTICAAAQSFDLAQVPAHYRPDPLVDLMSCKSDVTGRGFLQAVWNPASRQKNHVFVSAIQM